MILEMAEKQNSIAQPFHLEYSKPFAREVAMIMKVSFY